MTVFGLSISLCGDLVLGQSAMSPDAAAIIERYRQSLSWMESISMKIDIKSVPTGLSDKGPSGASLLFRYDHGRAEWRGRTFLYDKDGNVDPNVNLEISEIFSDNRYIAYDTPVNKPLTRAFVSNNASDHLQSALDDSGKGGPLWGRIYGNNCKNIADLLAESSGLAVSEEIINDVNCYLLQGTSKYGNVAAWIAPQMGYSALKWSIEKRKGLDLLDDKLSPMDSWAAVFDSVRFQEINGRFVPTTGVLVHTMVPDKEFGKVVVREDYTVSDIQLNPTFDSMGAFKADFSNGLRIYAEESPGIRYKWNNGAVVADIDGQTFEEIDRMIEQIKSSGN
jgi:hypothetical protein